MKERIIAVFEDVLKPASGYSEAELIYNEFPGWDSLAHMSIIAALELEFDCMMDMDEILDMSSLSKAIEIMGKYTG